MALTEAQRADVRIYCGWSARFRQFDSSLEQAMNALASYPETEAKLTNPLVPTDGSDPGLIACCKDAMAQLRLAMKRRKASKVGSIELNKAELEDIRELGRQYVHQMCTLLGVQRREDVFSPSGAGSFATFEGPSGGSNYIGK